MPTEAADVGATTGVANDYWRARPNLAAPGVSRGRARGLFAIADIPTGALIERACTVEVRADQTGALDAMRPLGDFYFEHPDDPKAGLMAFGLMSLLNHSDPGNVAVRWSRDDAVGWLADLIALRAVRAGEELTYRYKCALWFDAAP